MPYKDTKHLKFLIAQHWPSIDKCVLKTRDGLIFGIKIILLRVLRNLRY